MTFGKKGKTMSYDNNIQSSPEKFGLEEIAELEFSNQDYCFDTRIVWRRLKDGQLLSARDSGCSCPCPFEATKVEDLQEVNSITWLQEEIAEAHKSGYGGNSNLAQEAPEFIKKVEAALLRRVPPMDLNHI